MIVRLPYEKKKTSKIPELPDQNEDVDATLPYIDDKVDQIMDRVMTRSIKAARTSDYMLTSTPVKSSPSPSVFSLIVPFSPLTSPVSPDLPAVSKPKLSL